MGKKEKAKPIDGLSPKDVARIRTALRKVWSWSYPRRLVVLRCTGLDGFAYCEKCKKRAPKIFVDHIQNVGELDGGFIARLFVPSNRMQGLCKKCHAPKTQKERRAMRTKRAGVKKIDVLKIKDFY